MTRFSLAVRPWWLALGLLVAGAARNGRADDAVDYTRDVRPILAAHCFKCHGPDEQKSGLRLDAVSLAVEGGNSGAAIVRGKSAESALVKAITGADDVSSMPPDDAGPRLSAEQIATIRRWIDAGAPAPADDQPLPSSGRRKSDHWSFQPVAHPEPPVADAADATFVRNPIDAFILGRLARDGIHPSPEADRVTLIRRLSLDLLGIPPKVDDIDAFLADQSEGAYERLVDRMLASPHYGERQARHWLDLARYADSNGYTNDNPRTIWKYRDWVINALNADMPFDRFTIEQFAGDMLPDATIDQQIATGFHRNTLQNEEGGTDPEEFRIESVVDRVATTGTVFLGLSLGCARCHDHKYDPVSQRDFYQFFALLNGADEPILPVPDEAQAVELARLNAQITAAKDELAAYDVASADKRAAWEKQYAGRLDIRWHVVEPTEVASATGTTFTRLEDQSVLPGGGRAATDTYTVTAAAPVETVRGLRLEALVDDSLPRRGPGRADNGNFVLSEITLDLAAQPVGGGDATFERVAWQLATADYAQEKFPASHLIDGNDKTGWSIFVVDTSPHLNRTAVLVARDDCQVAGRKMVVSLAQQHAKPHMLLGRFRLAVTEAARDVLALPEPVRAALAVPADKRTPAQQETLLAEYEKTDPARQALTKKLAQSRARLDKFSTTVPTTLVMHERSQPRETHILVRGEYLRNGPVVSPDVPSVLPPLPAEVKNPSRVDLARWLVDPANPLTARVTVNRMWQQFFGRGIVETSNDFGVQGAAPTHPELLDWLAAEFMARGWSLKAMHRLIVTSGTYRQSSHTRPELGVIDPDNRLLARQSRLRVEAEIVRDCMLASSGLLSYKVGGPSVFPRQPDGVMALTRSPRPWNVSPGEDAYRRGMYTYYWRSTPNPFLKVLDAPDGITSCTRRERANTPLQALTLLNDDTCYEAAQAMATRVLAVCKDQPTAERIRYAFRLALAREPDGEERACLAELLADELASDAAPADAESTGQPVPAFRNPRLLAAWTTVSRALLNLDEFMTRE
ncbi:MAG TPA: PSD1 and planctomycete cytochrome C domain-containing protein [Pirellulales bacterium]|nr:PSD1 and planctomycete cytochrome C domain-containing protein [Pirellulales bacterium]